MRGCDYVGCPEPGVWRPVLRLWGELTGTQALFMGDCVVQAAVCEEHRRSTEKGRFINQESFAKMAEEMVRRGGQRPVWGGVELQWIRIREHPELN